MNSRVYTGEVTHARTWAAKHAFRYPVWFCALDLGELGDLQRGIPFFGHNRRRLVTVQDADYLTPGGEPLGDKLRAVLEAHGCAEGVSRVLLVTTPRVLGYVFNPVSFFCCLGSDGALHTVVANVNNTFGDAHLYVLRDVQPAKDGCAARYESPKCFHVSPFFDLDGAYAFQFTLPGDAFEVQVQLRKEGTAAFVAKLQGCGRELTSANLARTLLGRPLATFLTVPRITWQAARLYWQRKLPVHRRPNPFSPMTVRCAGPKWSRRLAMAGVLRVFGRLAVGRLDLELPDRRVLGFGAAGVSPAVRVQVRNWDFFHRLAVGGDIGLGEGYMAGDWECDDPCAFVRLLARNWTRVASARGAWIAQAMSAVQHRCRPNTLVGSRRNIRQHYDLSNDFFRLFLDETMLYSCAWFDAPEAVVETLGDADPAADAERLAKAQRAKIARLLQKAQIGPDDHVLEIGCGWGGLAIEAVRQTGCRVTGITVSQEQLRLAQERVSAAGLQDRIHLSLCDYREITGSYSRILSVEMLEAVGHAFLDAYFAALNRALAVGGRAVIQVITIPDERYDRYRRSSDFIRKHIFPGGHLPCLGALRRAAVAARLCLSEVESIGLHYAPTLRLWRRRLLANAAAVKALGFDDTFLRKWAFYFAYCEAGFAERVIDDVQFVVHRGVHDAPV